MAMPFDMDMTEFTDIASGTYDLDRKISGGVLLGANVGGIYQIGTDVTGLTTSVAVIEQDGGQANRAMIWQSGQTHVGRITQTDGMNNTSRLMQVGSGHVADLIQTRGSNNLMMVQMLGDGARINASQVDAVSNVLSVVLNSGSQFSINQTGTGNSYNINLAPNTSMTINQTGGQISP